MFWSYCNCSYLGFNDLIKMTQSEFRVRTWWHIVECLIRKALPILIYFLHSKSCRMTSTIWCSSYFWFPRFFFFFSFFLWCKLVGDQKKLHVNHCSLKKCNISPTKRVKDVKKINAKSVLFFFEKYHLIDFLRRSTCFFRRRSSEEPIFRMQ